MISASGREIWREKAKVLFIYFFKKKKKEWKGIEEEWKEYVEVG